MRVQTALEVASEFVLYILRQALARALVRVLEEALQVLLDDTVEDGFLGAALSVLFRFGAGHRARASATSVPVPRSAAFASLLVHPPWRTPRLSHGFASWARG
jgi:hypothetical protein